VNVSFFPGVAGALVGVPMQDVVGCVVSPDDVWPRDFREALAELEPLPLGERVSRLSDSLLARSNGARARAASPRGCAVDLREARSRAGCVAGG
jgi:hypothetical protein